MTLKLNGTNSVAAPAYAGDDADTGLQCGTNELKLVTGGTARATVDSSGNVGIGTVSPSANLEVSAAGANASVLVDRTDAATAGTVSLNAGNGVNYINNSGTKDFAINTAGTERMRILSSGGITFNGDTAAANALDDYEQGTWDPTVAFGGSSSGVIYNEQQGIYVKIGNLVWASMVMSLTNNGSGSGTITISLPFAVGDNSENRAVGTLSYFANFSGLNSNPNVYAPSGGSTTCRLQQLNNSSGSGTQVTTLTDSNVTNGASWRAAVMYTTID